MLYNYTVMPTVRVQRFAAKLSPSTHDRLVRFLDDQRHLWNAALQERIEAYRKCGQSISVYDQFKSLTKIRADDPHYAGIAVAAQRSILFRLERGFQGLFRRLRAGERPGFPRFRSKRRAVRSFEIGADCFTVRQHGSWLSVTLKGIGRFRCKGTLDGEPKALRIVRTPRRVEIQIVVEIPSEAVAPDTREPVGLDLGIRSRVALSNGEMAPGTPLDRSELKRRQRKLARAERGSNGRRKKRQALAKEWDRVGERERGRLHELTATLVREHSARFYVEALKIRNMSRSAKGTAGAPGKNVRAKAGLNRAILEQNWGAFVAMLTYKAEEAGGWVRKVAPHGTSQKCSECGGSPEETLGLEVRTYKCTNCGYVADRDINAAKNILSVGLALDQPGGESPACREEQDQRGARPAMAGASCDGTERYRRAA